MNIKEYISSGIIEAYVLGQATAEEVSILECIRKNNIEVEQAILKCQILLEDFVSAQALKPPPGLKDEIWSKINDQSQDIKKITVEESLLNTNKNSIVKKDFDWKKLAVAASLLFVTTLGTTIYFQNKNKESQLYLSKISSEQISNAESLANLQQKWNLLQNPNLKRVKLIGVETHPDLIANVFWDEKTSEVFLSSENLPKTPENMQYQLWAIVDGVPIDAGTFDFSNNNEINKMLEIQKAQAFAITLEKAGGSPTPNLTQLYVMGNI